MSNPGRIFHGACGLLLVATLGLAACATQPGDWAAPAGESAAKEETQSANLQSETWKFDCKMFEGPPRHYPLDLVIELPGCIAGGVVVMGVILSLVAIAAPVAIIESASRQLPASDTEEEGIPGESEAH